MQYSERFVFDSIILYISLYCCCYLCHSLPSRYARARALVGGIPLTSTTVPTEAAAAEKGYDVLVEQNVNHIIYSPIRSMCRVEKRR